MSLLSTLRDALRRPAAPPPAGRRQFVRRASAFGAVAAGGGLFLPEHAWAAIEERAAHFGIIPGTHLDAMGRPMNPPAEGASPWVGEVMMAGFPFAVRGFALCNGQLLPINQNQSLYSLLGTTFGGDGRTTFGLPDLRGRQPIGAGNGAGLSSYALGQAGGAESVTLTAQELASHQHAQPVSTAAGTTRAPGGNVPAADADGVNVYDSAPNATFKETTPTGGGQSHNNMAPYLAINYQISLQGLFPSRN